MEPVFESRPAFSVLGMLYRGKNEHGEIPRLWGDLAPRREEIAGQVEECTSYGVEDHQDPDGTFEYLAGLCVEGEANAPEGMVRWEVPANTYAVFRTTLSAIGQTYQHIYREWLPTSGRQRAPGPEFEYYTMEFNPSDPASTFYLYVPVQ